METSFIEDVPTVPEGAIRTCGVFSANSPLAGYPIVYNIEMDPHETSLLQAFADGDRR